MLPSLLSDPLRWLWVAVYVTVVVVHCSHAVAIRGESRAWHAGHVVMACGMAAMFAPDWVRTGPTAAWEAVFVAATAAILAWMVRAWSARRPVDPRWVLSLVDMAAMAYMLALPTAAIPAVTYGFVAHFAAVALAWLTGVFDGEYDPFRSALDHRPRSAADTALAGVRSVSERVSLAAMTAGMAYMFVAMQVGT